MVALTRQSQHRPLEGVQTTRQGDRARAILFLMFSPADDGPPVPGLIQHPQAIESMMRFEDALDTLQHVSAEVRNSKKGLVSFGANDSQSVMREYRECTKRGGRIRHCQYTTELPAYQPEDR